MLICVLSLVSHNTHGAKMDDPVENTDDVPVDDCPGPTEEEATELEFRELILPRRGMTRSSNLDLVR